MPDVCYKCKVEIHGSCVPTQVGLDCKCDRQECKTTDKPSGGGYEKQANRKKHVTPHRRQLKRSNRFVNQQEHLKPK